MCSDYRALEQLNYAPKDRPCIGINLSTLMLLFAKHTYALTKTQPPSIHPSILTHSLTPPVDFPLDRPCLPLGSLNSQLSQYSNFILAFTPE